jgi:hypothetical protein
MTRQKVPWDPELILISVVAILVMIVCVSAALWAHFR